MVHAAGSTVVVGMPGMGKTWYARRQFSTDPADRAIWLTPVYVPEDWRDYLIVWNVKDLVVALSRVGKDGKPKAAQKKVVWVYNKSQISEVEKFFRVLRRNQELLTRHGHQPPQVTLYWDECHQVASRYATLDNPVVECISQCGNYGIRAVVISQQLGMTSKMAYGNAEEFVVYNSYPGDYDDGSISRLHMPPEVAEWSQRKHYYARWWQGHWYMGDPAYKEIPFDGEGEAPEEDEDEGPRPSDEIDSEVMDGTPEIPEESGEAPLPDS